MRKYKMNILKKFALAGAGAAIAALGVTYAPAAAQQGGYYIYEYTYYSDASKTEQVGFEFQHCDRPADSYGTTTPYYDRARVGFCQYGGGGGEY